MVTKSQISRRSFGKLAAAASVFSITPLRYALGANPLKVGLVLPYSGSYAKFGEGITDGLNFVLQSRGGHIAGRPVELIRGDDQLDAKIGGEVARKFVSRDNVDVIIGPVGSNVAPVVHKICIDNNVPLIIPTAASNDLTRAKCNSLVYRTSHSHWQLAFPMGAWLVKRGIKRVTTMAMNYAAGKEEIEAFKEGFLAAGGEIVDEKWPGIAELDYQAYFADVLSKKPDGIFTFFAGSNAVEFVKQYEQAGLKGKVPLFGVQYLTDSTLLAAQGAAAENVIVSAYWVPTLQNAANKKFIGEFKAATGKEADLNSMHGHDTMVTLAMALETTKGDIANRAAFASAMSKVAFESPRGSFRFGKGNNPAMDIYAVDCKGGSLQVIETIQKTFADTAAGCNLSG